MGTFGATTVRVPRARLVTPEGKTAEWRNATIPAYQRRTKRADALITGAYLSGTNTRRVRRALAALFDGIVRVNSILPAPAPGRPGAPLFLLTNHQCARSDSTPKIAYTYLP